MKRCAAIMFAGSLLALALWSMTAYSADDEEKQARKQAQDAILKLVDSMQGNKADVKAQAAAIKKKFDALEPIMWVYKPKNKGGVGMKDGSGIELELGRLGGPKDAAERPPKSPPSSPISSSPPRSARPSPRSATCSRRRKTRPNGRATTRT